MGLDEDGQRLIDAAFDRYLDAEIKRIRAGAEGSAEERLSAFERAKRLYATFRSKAQADQLKELGSQLYEDPEFKKELAAKQAYDKALQQCSAVKDASTIRPRLMQALAKQYQETYYGELAANDGKAVRPKSIRRLGKILPRRKSRLPFPSRRSSSKKYRRRFRLRGMQSYETKRFLFFSDIPPQIINDRYLPYLDSMYMQLCGPYGFDAGKNIWRGKAVIVAFASEASFQQFELAFYHDPKPGHQGIAHCDIKKNVVISCFAGNNPEYFSVVLVHETAHGFSWCYKSAESLPNWLNEGASEWIAHRVVTSDTIDRQEDPGRRWSGCGIRGAWAATFSRSTKSTPGSMAWQPASPTSS